MPAPWSCYNVMTLFLGYMYEVSQPFLSIDKNLLGTIAIMATTVVQPQTLGKNFDDEIVSLT
jgi:hypothetical protein